VNVDYNSFEDFEIEGMVARRYRPWQSRGARWKFVGEFGRGKFLERGPAYF
jgi:hypothetical protein